MKTVKNGDPTTEAALRLVVSLNQQDVSLEYGIFGEMYLISKIHPVGLKLPEGWHFSKSAFRKEDNDAEGSILCFKPCGRPWQSVMA